MFTGIFISEEYGRIFTVFLAVFCWVKLQQPWLEWSKFFQVLYVSEKREKINEILRRYKGTHSFHNFTSGKEKGQDSACRFIMDFYYDEPFVNQNVEFIKFTIKVFSNLRTRPCAVFTLRVTSERRQQFLFQGQSFMIHQIRKMMGLLIVIVSNRAADEHFDRAFSEPLEDIPKAPGTGQRS